MKTKLLRRLRKRAFWDIGMTAWKFQYNQEHILKVVYGVGARLDIWQGNFRYLKHFLYRCEAEAYIRSRRQEYILSLVKDLRQDKAHKQLKKLDREVRWL